jgi:hypothetical protein
VPVESFTRDGCANRAQPFAAAADVRGATRMLRSGARKVRLRCRTSSTARRLVAHELPLGSGDTPWSKVPCVPVGNSLEERTMTRNFAWSLGFCVFFVVPAASAQVLKCTDAEGNVTYSDVPCLRSEKTTIVDTRASSNVMDHSSIRAHQSRLAAPQAPAPVSVAPPAAPPSSPATSTVNRQVQPARTYSR